MMRSNKEIAKEARHRVAVFGECRKHRRKRIKIGALIAVCVILVVCLASLPGSISSIGPAAQAAVTIFDGEAVGGYVLAGVLGFALGGLVMFIYLRRKKN